MTLTQEQKQGLEKFNKEFHERIERVMEKAKRISEPRRKAIEFVKKKFERDRIKNFYANDIIVLSSVFKIKKNMRKKIKIDKMKFMGLRYKLKIKS